MKTMVPTWTMRGIMTGDCNCAWGCPCNFDAAPTYGDCEGVYAFRIDEGAYGDVELSGLSFIWYAAAPGAIHDGNMTAVVVIDARATDEQFAAIDALTTRGDVGMPFDAFVGLTTTFIDVVRADIEFVSDGTMPNTVVRAGGGSVYELVTARVANPVTGEEEELYLDKPTGFTSLRSELGTSTVASLHVGDIQVNNAGRYAEVAAFRYAGP
jgi:hypothetical protein